MPFNYDVFISYRHVEPDRGWTRDVLVPRLEAGGLSVCIDIQCFRLGVPVITEMERAVQESRYTLAILSPAYLAGGFTELENLMADHLGIEERGRRLIALMREQCEPRLGIRFRTWLDMTDDAEFEVNTRRLIGELSN